MNKNFRDLLNERLKDENFKKEFDELTPEYEVVKAFLNARKQSNMTQKELSEKSGVAQSDISKLENGNSNPSIKMLQRLANSMNMHIKVEFVPNNYWLIEQRIEKIFALFYCFKDFLPCTVYCSLCITLNALCNNNLIVNVFCLCCIYK